MDIKEIKQLVELFESSVLSAMEISEGDTRVRMERNVQPPAVAAAMQPGVHEQSTTYPIVGQVAESVFPQPLDVVDFNRLTEIRSPMVGVFYAAPSPEADPYVRRGDRVKKGDVLCVIEAMKLLNEIVAEADGEIADICVQNGQVVEFSQTLFRLF